MSKRPRYAEHVILVTIILSYTALGVLYATLTPAWQVPDEPAHYNYVRHLVKEKSLPVLRPGDYDQAYLDKIREQRFDPALSIATIRYESHQPPLYYLLLLPVYVVFDGELLPLRLVSVLLGAGLLVIAYLVGKAIFPGLAWPALGMTAFIAFIPQHIAMTAAVENDTLAELLLGIVLLGLIRWLQCAAPEQTGRLVRVSVFMGLALLTKVGVYIVVPLAFVAMWLKFWAAVPRGQRGASRRHAFTAMAKLLLPALLLSLPWFIRNVVVYGDLDFAGLNRHNQVVVGQLRTSEWIAANGWASLPGAFLGTTFRSFWAQFGWMAVPIDTRIYGFLGGLSAIVSLGFILALLDAWEEKRKLSPAAVLLVCSALMTLATYLGYNLGFYQAQGRYLFPALIPMGLAWAIGLRSALEPRNALVLGIVLTMATLGCGIRSLLGAFGARWRLVMQGIGAALLWGRWALPERLGNYWFALPCLLLAALSTISPFWFIVPYLSP